MMRKSGKEAAETRRSAVEEASKLYRERGLDAVSVADVMGGIGMTVGGFYRHFES
jgi:TetR/AcrR family transcriptional repressor of nem operon